MDGQLTDTNEPCLGSNALGRGRSNSRLGVAGRWWESPPCIALVVIATMLPLIYPPIPPLVDLFGHIGRYRVELDLGRSPFLQRFYEYRWGLYGNLGTDGLMRLLVPVIGLESAVKLIVIVIPPLTAVGILWVAREVHGRIPPTAFLSLPFIYGFPFLFGFVNFALSVALAFLALGLWLRLGRLGRPRLRTIIFVPISFIVYFAHAYGWGLMGLMCLSAEAVRLRDCGRSWFEAGAEAVLRASFLALPILIMVIRGSETQAPIFGPYRPIGKLHGVLEALRDRWRLFDISSVAIVLLFFVFAMAIPRFRASRELVSVAAAVSAWFLIVPNTLFGSDYADARIVPYLLVLALLAIDLREAEQAGGSIIAALAIAFFAVRLAGTSASLAIAAADQRSKLDALEYIPEGSRVFTLTGDRCSNDWPLPRNAHLGGMVIERRSGFSNDQWRGSMSPLHLRVRLAGYFASDPSEIASPDECRKHGYLTVDETLRSMPRRSFDYIWLIDPPSYDRRLTAGMELVWSAHGTALYSLPHSASTPSV